MNTKRYKQKLEEEKAKLESEMTSIGRKSQSVPGDWEPLPPETGTESDIIDQADAAMDRETNTAIFTDIEALYDMVTAALARIDNGTYGVCEECGRAIEAARLDADPAAATCVAHR